MSTYQEAMDYAGQISHRDPSSTTHTTLKQRALSRALKRISTANRWWFTFVELKQTLTPDQRLYTFPTTDLPGNAITLSDVDKQSFRTTSINYIEWWERHDLTNEDPDWNDGASSGVPYAVTLIGKSLAVYPYPSAAFIASNPSLYFDGWQMLPEPAEGATLDYSSEISLIPEDWHEVVDECTLTELYRQARSNRWKESYQKSSEDLRKMKRECKGAVGVPFTKMPPAPQFTRGNRRRRGQGRWDYGLRASR